MNVNVREKLKAEIRKLQGILPSGIYIARVTIVLADEDTGDTKRITIKSVSYTHLTLPTKA